MSEFSPKSEEVGNVDRMKELERELMEIRGEREKELERRREIAEIFMGEVQKELDTVISWKVGGSTAREDFAFSSDLDIDVLLKKDPNEDESLILYHYLVQRFLEEKELFIQPHTFTIDQLKRIKSHNPEIGKWYEEYFDLEEPL